MAILNIKNELSYTSLYAKLIKFNEDWYQSFHITYDKKIFLKMSNFFPVKNVNSKQLTFCILS